MACAAISPPSDDIKTFRISRKFQTDQKDQKDKKDQKG